jgi:hypothetical protein
MQLYLQVHVFFRLFITNYCKTMQKKFKKQKQGINPQPKVEAQKKKLKS